MHKVQGRMTWTPPNFVKRPLGGQPLPQGCRARPGSRKWRQTGDAGLGGGAFSWRIQWAAQGTGSHAWDAGTLSAACLGDAMWSPQPVPSPAAPPLAGKWAPPGWLSGVFGDGSSFRGDRDWRRSRRSCAPPGWSAAPEVGDTCDLSPSGHCQAIAQSVRRNER